MVRTPLQENFHEKAHSVERNDPSSFAMLPSALVVSLLSGDSVHYGIRLDSDY